MRAVEGGGNVVQKRTFPDFHFPKGTNIFSSTDEVMVTEVTTLLSILSGADVYKVWSAMFFPDWFLMFN